MIAGQNLHVFAGKCRARENLAPILTATAPDMPPALIFQCFCNRSSNQQSEPVLCSRFQLVSALAADALPHTRFLAAHWNPRFAAAAAAAAAADDDETMNATRRRPARADDDAKTPETCNTDGPFLNVFFAQCFGI